MRLGWKVYLPLSVSCVLMTAAILMTFFDFNLFIHTIDLNQTIYYLEELEKIEKILDQFKLEEYKSGTLLEYKLPTLSFEIEMLLDFGDTNIEEMIFYVPEGMKLLVSDDQFNNVRICEVLEIS
jgi:hypothetical protein